MLEQSTFEKLKAKVRPALIFESKKLSSFLGFPFWIATETFQHTGSFKYRAALNVVLNSNSPHFITVSSGNFGQALSFATSQVNRRCTILMPETSAKVKIEAVKEYGAEVVLIDTKTKSRKQWLFQYVCGLKEVYEVVSPYDDDRVIEGNSSLADDLIDSGIEFGSVLVPVGGGGLAAGIVQGLQRNNASQPVYGVEPMIANDAARSLAKGTLVANETEPMTIADGVRTLSLGEKNWAILKTGLDSVLEVEEREIVEAVKLYFDRANLKVEPSGALSLAALLKNKDIFCGPGSKARPLVIVSGGNVDQEVYSRLIAST